MYVCSCEEYDNVVHNIILVITCMCLWSSVHELHLLRSRQSTQLYTYNVCVDMQSYFDVMMMSLDVELHEIKGENFLKDPHIF